MREFEANMLVVPGDLSTVGKLLQIINMPDDPVVAKSAQGSPTANVNLPKLTNDALRPSQPKKVTRRKINRTQSLPVLSPTATPGHLTSIKSLPDPLIDDQSSASKGHDLPTSCQSTPLNARQRGYRRQGSSPIHGRMRRA